MKIKGLVFFSLLFAIGVIQAQPDFRPGYIVKGTGDSLSGEIDYRGDVMMGTSCCFKPKDAKTGIRYSPDEIIAYRFYNSRYYVSKEGLDGRKVFLEFLIKGKVSIYYLRDEKGDHYFIEKDGLNMVEIPYEEGIKEKDNSSYFYKSKTHIGLLNVFMQDAPDLKAEIARIDRPGHENLIKLVKDYQNEVCKDDKCIIYEKQEPFVKINYEILTGITNFEGDEDIKDKNYFQGGLLIHIWMPGVNEKLYFETGLLVSQFDHTDGTKGVFPKIPFHIGYMAPKSYKVRPFASIGLISPSYSGGLMFRLNHTISFGFQSYVNFTSSDALFFVPEELYNYSFLASTFIEL